MTLVPFIQYVSQPVVSITHALAVVLAALDHQPITAGLSVAAAFSISAGLLGAACIYWACFIHARLSNFRLAVAQEKANAEMTAHFREALLARGSQPIVVLRNGAKEPQYFAEGQDLLMACRGGPDGPALAIAQEHLVEMGTSFTLEARVQEDRILIIHGMPIADRAVLFFQEDSKAAPQFRAMLEALPVPVWLYADDLTLRWANNAFLRIFGAAAHTTGKSLDWLGPDQAAAARAAGKPVEMRHHARIGDERRNFAVSLLPAPDEMVGIALDVTAFDRTETRLTLDLHAHTDMMDRLGIAIAVFDADRRLTGHNRAYGALWGFADAWLETSPLLDEILEKLRDARKLPEQRSFAEWKLEQTQLFGSLGVPAESLWHLPGGASLRVMAEPHLSGGIFMTFEDISDKLRLEASVTLLTQVQRATLDAIEDGLAIFGTHGRLIQYNSRFAKMWKLTEEELSGQPHFAEIAAICATRTGRDGVWGIVSCGVNSANPETLGEWSRTRRAEQHRAWRSFARQG
jgi:PAS domain-containing protein